MTSVPTPPNVPNTGPPNSPAPKWQVPWPLLLMLAFLLAIFWLWAPPKQSVTAVDYSVFYAWVEQGKVASVVLDGANVEGRLKEPTDLGEVRAAQFRSARPEDASLLPLLREKQVAVRVVAERSSTGNALLQLLPWVLIIGGWIWLSRRAQKLMTGNGPLGMLKSHSRKFEKSEAVNVTFDDVAGLGSVKRDLQEIVLFLREPERFRKLGGKVPRGVLLVGPPGTGKTLLARAVAGESGVPFFSISASEFIEMFVGVGAARVRDLFAEARKASPAIVFIDELDAVGRSRGAGLGGGHDEREQTLNQLLSEMDGFDRNDLTIVLAATNRPDVLDPALLRPGRFDRRVMVDRPELQARRAILGVHVKGKPLHDAVDLDLVARSTAGFSGADLANLANEAALSATRRDVELIGPEDFRAAFDKIVLGDARDGKLGEEERQRVAVHESGHAVVARYEAHAEAPHRVTIIPRGMALGVTQQVPVEDRHILTEPQLGARLRVLMGGYAAERLVFGTVSTGAENDLKEATKIASKMVANYGMSKKLGPVYYDHEAEHPFLGQRIATDGGASDATTFAIEDEARSLLSAALADATSLLSGHRAELDALRSALLARETIEQGELEQLMPFAPPTGVHVLRSPGGTQGRR